MSRAQQIKDLFDEGGPGLLATVASAMSFSDAKFEFDDIYCGDEELTQELFEELQAGFAFGKGQVSFKICFADGSVLAGVTDPEDFEGEIRLVVR